MANKYVLLLHSRPSPDVSAEEKHATFFRGIKELGEPWGAGSRVMPRAPAFNGNVGAVGDMRGYFGEGVRKAQVMYRYRRSLDDTGLCDDRLTLVIDSYKIDNYKLIYNIIPKYVSSFDSYLAEYFDDRWVRIEREVIGSRNDRRFGIQQFGAATFLDSMLCERAFGLSPADFQERLKDVAECVQLMYTGVYIVGTSRILSFPDAQQLCSKIKTAVFEAPPAS